MSEEIRALMKQRDQFVLALEGMIAEWDKFTRYGSPMAKAANERVAFARKVLAAATAMPEEPK